MTYVVCGQGPVFATNSKIAAEWCARCIPLGFYTDKRPASVPELPQFRWGLLLTACWRLRREST